MRLEVIVFISMILTSCGIKYHDSISGNGKVIETTVSSDTIRSIKVSDKLDVTLIPSDTNRVILKADENLHDIIKISIERGVLRISAEK